MLLWILLSTGLALSVLAVVCVRVMVKAERRARRNLYASLGCHADLIPLLMARKGPVSVQLARLRQALLSGGALPDDLRQAEGVAAQRSFRFAPKTGDQGAAASEQPALAPARRKPPGRPPL